MSIRNEEQFKAWWEANYNPVPGCEEAAIEAWNEAHKQRDEESNLIIGKGFWGRAFSNISNENKQLKEVICTAVEVLRYYRSNCLVHEKTGQFVSGEFAASDEWGFMVTNKKAADALKKMGLE